TGRAARGPGHDQVDGPDRFPVCSLRRQDAAADGRNKNSNPNALISHACLPVLCSFHGIVLATTGRRKSRGTFVIILMSGARVAIYLSPLFAGERGKSND